MKNQTNRKAILNASSNFLLICAMLLLFVIGYKYNERAYSSDATPIRHISHLCIDKLSVLTHNCQIEEQEDMLNYLYLANCKCNEKACRLVYYTIMNNYSKNGILKEPYSEIACHYLKKGAEYGDNECIDKCKLLNIVYGQK